MNCLLGHADKICHREWHINSQTESAARREPVPSEHGDLFISVMWELWSEKADSSSFRRHSRSQSERQESGTVCFVVLARCTHALAYCFHSLQRGKREALVFPWPSLVLDDEQILLRFKITLGLVESVFSQIIDLPILEDHGESAVGFIWKKRCSR